MNSQEIVSMYETLSQLTGQMLNAAGEADWDRLVVLEQLCASHVDQLRAHETAPLLEGSLRERKVNAIRKMLDDDRKIRDLTSPWLAELSALINNASTERRLARAYGG